MTKRIKSKKEQREYTVRLTESELNMLFEALGDHEYWGLTEPHMRNDGFSQVKDGEDAMIDACRALTTRLGEIQNEGNRRRRGKPVHAIDCDMDEDCTCGVTS